MTNENLAENIISTQKFLNFTTVVILHTFPIV